MKLRAVSFGLTKELLSNPAPISKSDPIPALNLTEDEKRGLANVVSGCEELEEIECLLKNHWGLKKKPKSRRTRDTMGWTFNVGWQC